MAQTGFTPISTYYTTTASAVPTAGNLVNGELALNINTADGKLFYKDSAGVVQVLATKDSTSGSFTNLSYTGTLTGGTGVVNLGSGQFYKTSGGLVGIGSVAPVSKLQVDGTSPINGVNATYVGSLQINESVASAQAVGGLEFKSASFGSGYGWKIVSLDSSGAQLTFNTRQNSATWSEQMRIDSSGNVGIGVSNPTQKISVGGRINFGAFSTNIDDYGLWATSAEGTTLASYSTTNLCFRTNNAERMRIDSSGNVGIGTSSPSSASGTTLAIYNASGQSRLAFKNSVTGNASTDGFQIGIDGDGNALVEQRENLALSFSTNAIERMRIDSSGNLLVGTTSALGGEKGNFTQTSNGAVLRVINNGASFADTALPISAARAATTAYNFIYCSANAVGQFQVRGDGVIFAQNTTVQSISDVRTKENIVNATDGIETINALRPVRFDFKEGFGNDKKNQLGFIAQEIEAVFPDAVDTWGESDDPEKPYKSVGTTALIPVLVKAIQEQQAMIETLTTRLNALEGK